MNIERRTADNASSISVASNTSLMSFTGGGTTRWMSPELLDPERFGIIDYRPTKQSDCYALGMVVYEVRADAIFPALEKLGSHTIRFFLGTVLTGKLRVPGW